MITGKVKVYKDDRGFGFIRRDDGGADVYFHVKNVHRQSVPIKAGDAVEFEIGAQARDGKAPPAVNVRKTSPAATSHA